MNDETLLENIGALWDKGDKYTGRIEINDFRFLIEAHQIAGQFEHSPQLMIYAVIDPETGQPIEDDIPF